MNRITRLLVASLFATVTGVAQAGPGCPAGATPGSPDCTGPRGAAALERFKAADRNGDGQLSREEVQAGMPRLAERFDALDANKDGLLSPEEIRAARHAMGGPGARGDGWKRWDTNGDGQLSREEVANAPRLLQDFDAIDTNRDGLLSADELRAAHARHAGKRRGA